VIVSKNFHLLPQLKIGTAGRQPISAVPRLAAAMFGADMKTLL